MSKKADEAATIGYTALYVASILVLGFSALVVREDIRLEDWATEWLGNFLAVIALATFITVVYKANKKG